MRDFFSPTTLDYNLIDKKVVIAIRFKEDPEQPIRLVNFNFLKAHYEKTFPNWTVMFGYVDDDFGNYSYGKTANYLMDKVFIEHQADIGYISDADTWVSTDALIESILYSIKTEEHSVPYTYVVETDKEQSEKIFKNENPCIDSDNFIPVCKEIVNGKYYLIPSGGCNVIPRKIYEDGLRFEEGYDGYAPDDVAFHKSYLDKYNRLFHFEEGLLYSVWNERPYNDKKFKSNYKILKEKYNVDFHSSYHKKNKTTFTKI